MKKYLVLILILCSYLINGQNKEAHIIGKINKSYSYGGFILTNNITKKSIDTRKDIKIIINTLGKPKSIRREPKPDVEGAPPWSEYVYDGLKINYIGEDLDEIIITNSNWTLDGFMTNQNIEDISKKYKKYKWISPNPLYKKDKFFVIPKIDCTYHFELNDKGNKIISFGIGCATL